MVRIFVLHSIRYFASSCSLFGFTFTFSWKESRSLLLLMTTHCVSVTECETHLLCGCQENLERNAKVSSPRKRSESVFGKHKSGRLANLLAGRARCTLDVHTRHALNGMRDNDNLRSAGSPRCYFRFASFAHLSRLFFSDANAKLRFHLRVANCDSRRSLFALNGASLTRAMRLCAWRLPSRDSSPEARGLTRDYAMTAILIICSEARD